MSERAALGRYVVYGQGMSGDTDDMNEARTWLANDGTGQARLYVQVSPQDDLVHVVAAAMCPPEASYCRERMIEEGDAAEIAVAVEAAGWGPRPEADAKVTAAKMRLLDLLRLEQVEAMGEEHMTALFGTVQEHVELISRGITVEGA